MSSQFKTVCLWWIGLGILFPLFVRLDGGIYRDAAPLIDSLGLILKLPLPVSIVACVGGLAFVGKGLQNARTAFLFIAATATVSFISLGLGSDGITPPERKLIMIFQVMLPMTALLLGQLIDDVNQILPRAFLVVLSIVVPWQLLATWSQGGLMLTHDLYAFSIYSHFQYVTLIFVCAFAYSLISLWEEHKLWLCTLMLPMLIYVTSGLSFLTIFAYTSLLIAFACHCLWRYRADMKLVLITLTLLMATAVLGLVYFQKMDGQRRMGEVKGGAFLEKFKTLSAGKIPINVQERIDDWKLFGHSILESKKTILVGHPEPMPREIRSSPHNWYLDMIYTFGLVGLLPILTLIGFTVCLCWMQRKTLSTQAWWLSAIVLYLVVIDSNFKVTLRQPYPGIFTFFLWGLLLSRLRAPVSLSVTS